ncbi:unnamed protein product [Paramecium pentaurelia]|uniref:Uncharacterized protein n=1 Tax=Paramecium pentaurelia TaxID=43138 RepID=A0A8S1X852_9CILI|nr:unnamed protein product [Paramecium pentaurelia]
MQILAQEMNGKIQIIMLISILVEGFNILGNLVLVVGLILAEYFQIQKIFQI